MNSFMIDTTQLHNLHRSDALDPYRKFVAFYTRSENLFVNYYSVLDVGMAWETSQFGDLSRDEFVCLFHVLCTVY
jgi:hypothetical protein